MNESEIIQLCLEEARKSLETGDVPIGAVLICENQVISVAHNTRELNHNILEHAEINVILEASKKLKRWNLSDCVLYVTLEPCSMCKEVIKQSRIDQVYYLLSKMDWKKEYNKTLFVMLNEKNGKQMYQKMLSDFFQSKRTK